jgi:hypothetical protein
VSFEVLKVLVRPTEYQQEINDALERIRVSSAGILFHIRYQPRGQQLKKEAAIAATQQNSSTLLANKTKCLATKVSSLDASDCTTGWPSVWVTFQQIQVEAKHNAAFCRVHEGNSLI